MFLVKVEAHLEPANEEADIQDKAI